MMTARFDAKFMPKTLKVDVLMIKVMVSVTDC